MEKKINKNLSFEEIYILIFPISILFRSAALNLYILSGALFFVYKYVKNKKNLFNKKEKIIFNLIILFFTYFILTSLTSENIYSSLKSSISQMRFLLFAFFIGSISININNIKKIILVFSLIIGFIASDTLFQYFFGYDFFGIKADPIKNPSRLSGPFGDELIVGTYLTYFTIPLLSYYCFNSKDNSNLEKLFLMFIILISSASILLSGERISLIIFIVSTLIIILLKYKVKIFLLFFFLISIFLSVSYKYNKNVQYRFSGFVEQVKQLEKSPHTKLFSSAIIVGKNKILTGAGLENYREDCDILKNKNFMDQFTGEQINCSTHPHNIYLEIFAEGGLIGLIFFLILIIYIVLYLKSKIIKVDNKLKFLFISSLIILASYIWPIKSSGSFFSTFSASFFWFYFGLILMLSKAKIKKHF